MDTDQPPAIIEIQKIERHDIKAEAIEMVARLLCRADGLDPDADWRAGPIDSNTMTSNMITVHVRHPDNLNWAKYKDRAEARLKNIFKPR